MSVIECRNFIAHRARHLVHHLQKVRLIRQRPSTANAAHRKYLIPGMMDVHIHLHGGFSKPPDERAGIRAMQSYLYCGVTTVLDVGNNQP